MSCFCLVSAERPLRDDLLLCDCRAGGKHNYPCHVYEKAKPFEVLIHLYSAREVDPQSLSSVPTLTLHLLAMAPQCAPL